MRVRLEEIDPSLEWEIRKMAQVIIPKKPAKPINASLNCVICGNVLQDSRKRVKLQHELFVKLQEILSSENLAQEGYLCNDTCYKSVNRYFELKSNLKDLKSTLAEKFQTTQEQRWKRHLPTDSDANQKVLRPQSELPLCCQSFPKSYPVIPRIIKPITIFPRPFQPSFVVTESFANAASICAPKSSLSFNIQDFQTEEVPVCKVEVRTLFFLG